MTCFCKPEQRSLCFDCVEQEVRRLSRAAERIGRRWGFAVYARRPDGVWPERWDLPEATRWRDVAHRKVQHLHTDADVLGRLAALCGLRARDIFRSEVERRRPRPQDSSTMPKYR